ncbi:MAG: hypothetical protein HC890_09920 [Chloroflexaceae bacterium]|nr:hypothetical protein [Chloroflexaceae bacterium]
MTVENLEQNGNQNPEENQGEHRQDNEMVALSVQSNAGQAMQPLKLKLREHSSLPGQRPVEASHLKIVDTYSSVGSQRPVTASTMEVARTLSISGNRPIAASHLNVSQTYTVMGNRPVASNEIDDPTNLMGYLD